MLVCISFEMVIWADFFVFLGHACFGEDGGCRSADGDCRCGCCCGSGVSRPFLSFWGAIVWGRYGCKSGERWWSR